MTPYDGSIEAEYSDGYIHSETVLGDVSPYLADKNIFNDILEKRPEAAHGPMVRFSCYYQNFRYDVNWSGLPANARPIRYKNMQRHFQQDVGWIGEAEILSIGFGYQYTDEQGRNVQEVREL